MFPNRSWLGRNLPSVGLWMFACGVVLMIAGLLGGLYYQELLMSHGTNPPAHGYTVIPDLLYNLSDPLIYNGVVLYLVGLLVGAWNVSLVGFETSDGKSLLVKGPDATNTVWIGRRYGALLEAEAASRALHKRFPRKEVEG